MYEAALNDNLINEVKEECTSLVRDLLKEDLASIATEIAMKHFAIVNFVCLPFDEFEEKKSWYPYFMNIATEGEVLYG